MKLHKIMDVITEQYSTFILVAVSSAGFFSSADNILRIGTICVVCAILGARHTETNEPDVNDNSQIETKPIAKNSAR